MVREELDTGVAYVADVMRRARTTIIKTSYTSWEEGGTMGIRGQREGTCKRSDNT